MREGHYQKRKFSLPPEIRGSALRNLLSVPADHDLFLGDSTGDDPVIAPNDSMKFSEGCFWFYSAPRKINQD
jgi:hypothetical protein